MVSPRTLRGRTQPFYFSWTVPLIPSGLRALYPNLKIPSGFCKLIFSYLSNKKSLLKYTLGPPPPSIYPPYPPPPPKNIPGYATVLEEDEFKLMIKQK